MEKSISVKSRRMMSWPLEMLLRILGIWPGVSYGLQRKVIWTILIACNTSFQCVFLIFHTRFASFHVRLYAFVGIMTMCMKWFKLIVFWWNERRFNEMWETMSANWSSSGAFADAVNMANKPHILHYLPNFVVAFNSFSVCINSYSIVSSGIRYDEASNATRPYILQIYFPFGNDKQYVYLLVVSLQFVYLLVVTAGTVATNSILIVLMLYLGDQIDMVCRCLTKMPPKKEERERNEIVMREMIRKHQGIVTFSENVECIYTYIALMLLLLNTLITCGLAFILVTAVGTPTFFKAITKSLLFFCAINLESFTFCFAGEYLSAKSKEIGEAAYYSPWYQSKSHSQAVLFMIMRSQKQLTITMGKFADLSLEQFTTILKTSMSYLSVLLAMY